ncbi:MAG: ATP-NAD kinase family protein [Pseudomonadota bacterium]
MNESRFRLGLIVNPWAGMGGSVGLRGSDGPEIRDAAIARGALPQAGERALRFLLALADVRQQIDLLSWAGPMGVEAAHTAGFTVQQCGAPASMPSSRADSLAAARALVVAGIDLLLFVGGDGTARDICDAVGTRVPVLGIPAGVKMYSGVFAVAPEAAADIVRRLIAGQPVTVTESEVRDIDEEAFRHDRVASRCYGVLLVPGVRGYVQHVKCGGREVEALTCQEIGAYLAESMLPGVLYLVGTGSTPKSVLATLGLPGSLLGIDAVVNRQLVANNLDAAGIASLLAVYPAVQLVVTATGGQGFLFGRGNQQLSAAVLRSIGADNFLIVATRAKLEGLDGRALLVDTGDRNLDHALAGLRPVITGYDQRVLYRVAAADAPD